MRIWSPTDIDYTAALTEIGEGAKSVIEYGSGESTAIFADLGAQVTCIEYDPPGDWYGVGQRDNVAWVLLDHEKSFAPKNLLQAATDLLVMRPDIPRWDLAYIDGGIHVEGLRGWAIGGSERPGFCGGWPTYQARCMLAALLAPYCKRVIIDDVDELGDFPGKRMGRFLEFKGCDS